MSHDHERMMLQVRAIAAHTQGDWEAERKALDAIHMLDQQDPA